MWLKAWWRSRPPRHPFTALQTFWQVIQATAVTATLFFYLIGHYWYSLAAVIWCSACSVVTVIFQIHTQRSRYQIDRIRERMSMAGDLQTPSST